MKGFNHRVANALDGVTRALESRWGRLFFYTAVAVMCVVQGAVAVVRAEFPKKIHVEELHYTSPVQIGSPSDTRAKYHSSEFQGMRRLSWGAVVEGLDQYSDLHRRAYPPFFAIAFFPFAAPWQTVGLGSALFFLTGYSFGLLSAWCLARWWQPAGEKVRFGLFALIWLLMAPFIGAVLARCETDMFVILPVAAAMLLLSRQRGRYLAGGMLGFAASLKLTPALFGVYLLCQRRWRAALGMGAAGLLCTVALPVAVWGPGRAWQQHLSWHTHVLKPYFAEGTEEVIGRPYRSTNQSLTAALHRFLRPIRAGKRGDPRRVNVAELSRGTVDRISTLLQALLGVGLMGLWWKCRRPEGRASPLPRGAAFATVPLGMLLLSGVSLTTHHILLVVPWAVLICGAVGLRAPAARQWCWAGVGAVLITLAGTPTGARLFSPFLAGTALSLAGVVAVLLRSLPPGCRAAKGEGEA